MTQTKTVSAERLQKMLDAEIPLGMSVEDARSIITEVLASRHQEPVELADTDGFGWVFWNPDSGEEYSLNHPIESGECPDAERIRSSTTQEDVLYEAMQEHFQALRAASIPKTGHVPNAGKKVEPGVKGSPVTLAECPIGLFYAGGELCLKTEYGDNNGRIDAFIVSSGEFFWGGTSTPQEQRKVLVQPFELSPSASEGEDPDGLEAAEAEVKQLLAQPKSVSSLPSGVTPEVLTARDFIADVTARADALGIGMAKYPTAEIKTLLAALSKPGEE